MLERQRTRIVGVLEKAGRRVWRLQAEDPRIVRAIQVVGGPASGVVGELVVGAITSYPEDRNDPIPRSPLSAASASPGCSTLRWRRALVEAGIDETFPEDVENEAVGVPTQVREPDLDGRADLRQLPFMTIDPTTRAISTTR